LYIYKIPSCMYLPKLNYSQNIPVPSSNPLILSNLNKVNKPSGTP
jgi:hypothetical protein